MDFKERVVKVQDEVVFKQGKTELTGTFSGNYSHLTLA